MGTNNFSSTLDSLKGFYVDLYVGEEIIKGKLMGVEADHIVLEDEKQYVYYYNIDQIQAITKNTKQFQSAGINSEFMKTQSLRDLLQTLKNSWVSILCLNKQSFNGVLSIVDEDFVTLINGEDRILVKFTHIANILKGFRKEENKKESKNNTEEKNSENTNVASNEKNQKDKSEKVKAEKESTTVIINEAKNDQKVWSEPIMEKTVVSSVKTNIEMKKPKNENVMNEKKQQKIDMNQTQSNESKVQKNEVVHQVSKREKEPIQQPPYLATERKSQAKEVPREAAPARMETITHKEEPPKNVVKKVKQEIDTQPLMKIDNTKKNTIERKKIDERPVPQEVGASRFAGEPVARNFDRRSIFSGWPGRKTSRRF